MHFERNALPDGIARIVAASFPAYTGRKIEACVAESVTCSDLWDGGTRSWWTFVRLDTYQSMAMPPDTTWQTGKAQHVPLVPGLVAVEHHIYRGEDMGLTLWVHALDMPKYLPACEKAASELQVIVLWATRSFKSSYNGRSDYRFTEARDATGITRDEWEGAKAECIAAGLLNKAGAITPKGKNATEHLGFRNPPRIERGA